MIKNIPYGQHELDSDDIKGIRKQNLNQGNLSMVKDVLDSINPLGEDDKKPKVLGNILAVDDNKNNTDLLIKNKHEKTAIHYSLENGLSIDEINNLYEYKFTNFIKYFDNSNYLYNVSNDYVYNPYINEKFIYLSIYASIIFSIGRLSEKINLG